MMMWLFKVGKKGAPNPAPATEVTEAVSHLEKEGKQDEEKTFQTHLQRTSKAWLCREKITQAKFSNVAATFCVASPSTLDPCVLRPPAAS